MEGHGADEIFGGYPVNHIEYLYYLVKNFRLNEASKTFQISKKFWDFFIGIYKSLLGRLLISLFKGKNIHLNH